MKLLEISDNEIVTMNDYPIHDLQTGVSDGVILKLYFRIFQKHCADIVARTIILPEKLVASAFHKKTKKKFNEFEKKHPQVKYFALDGNHRTTAASLTKSKIPAMLFENDRDCKEIQKMNNSPEVFRPYTNNTLNECVLELKDHFLKAEQFYTVAEKTKRMVEDMSIDMPQYMRDSFNGK